jgi:AraC-like DNA-binding protein
MGSLSAFYDRNKEDASYLISSKHYKININNLGADWSELFTITKITEYLYIEGNKQSQNIRIGEVDCLCLFYSTTTAKWKTDDNNGVLKQGGIVLFDCRQSFTYTVWQSSSVILIMIPYQIYDAGNITKMLEGRGFIYSGFILSILREMDNGNDHELKNKIFSLVHILPVVSENVNTSKLLSLFEKIKRVIHAHALDTFFSLDKAASLSFCSKRKLHNCLATEGTSYSKMVNDYRINYLAEQLVTDRRARVETLCYKSGFNSPSYASKQFKLVKGVTPLRYRGFS